MAGWITIAVLATDVRNYSDRDLAASTTYYYRIKARGDGGDSSYSNMVAATTPGGATGAIVALTLTNTSASATPATTFVPFGHAFTWGDVPGGSRLAATWQPRGGAEAAVQVQVSRRVSHGEGSLRFAGIGVKLPAVAGSGTGTLRLYKQPGAQGATIPGGRTAAQVRDELVANFPFAVAATNLRRGMRLAVDGSGSWTWSAATQLALLGATDARGRVRCEAIESGPLFVTFHAWGPLVDNKSRASHPHLVVRAWYRCWLDGATSTIDRVEYLHSLEQGWIEDLAGGTVAADIQVADVAVTLSGSALPGRSWTGLRVVHHTANPLAAIDDTATSASWQTGGSDWTSGRPTLHTSIDRHYWRSTGLVPPYDLEYYDANGIVPATSSSSASFLPGARPDGEAGALPVINRALNNTGASPGIGLMPLWDIRAFISNAPGYLRDAVTTALNAGSLPVMIRNPSTGRIPILLQASSYPSSDVTLLGPNRHTTYYYDTASSSHSSDIALVERPSPFRGGSSYSDPNNWDGAWGGGGTLDMSHFPSLAYYSYLRTGAPWFLETIKVHANHALMVSPPIYRTQPLPGGGSIDGRIICWSQEREEAWSWKMLAQCLAVLPDNAPERPYLQEFYDGNAAGAAGVVANMGASSAGFTALGCWTFVSTRPDLPGGFKNLWGTPWMQNYLAQARAFEYLALRPGTSSDCWAWLQHYKKALAGYGGGSTPPRDCGSFGAGAYNTMVGWGASIYSYYTSWDDVPTTMDNGNLAYFDATARSTGGIWGHLNRLTKTPGNLPLVPGDRVMFTLLTGGVVNNAPPSPLVPGRWYYIASIVDANRVILSPNADLSSPITSYGSFDENAACGFAIGLDRLPAQGGAGTHFVQGEGTAAYAAICWMATRMFCAAGVIDPDAAWVKAFDRRMTTMVPDWREDPTYRVSKSR